MLTVQQPAMACSSVPGRLGISGRGTPAPVEGGNRVENRRQARAVRALRVNEVVGRFKCTNMQDAALRCCVAAVCELQRVESGRSGWIEPDSEIQVQVPRVVATVLTSHKP